MKAKASEIVQAEKWKGKEVLDKVSEFDGLKESLCLFGESLDKVLRIRTEPLQN